MLMYTHTHTHTWPYKNRYEGWEKKLFYVNHSFLYDFIPALK